uniref:Uncharacterized protein n=1 Tax=Rubinisphaera brasiliensis (strain ATCC 49424 / DSM 5305 / JCM 21570 / IAM 15109 / NBRC 103401 / IFAM 1448) TaxID=756272 RepID=F0SM41_RUBBR|nr:hypothetical protein Plabr_3399 [Rubinisphaera brasiliensis DSM 5305]
MGEIVIRITRQECPAEGFLEKTKNLPGLLSHLAAPCSHASLVVWQAGMCIHSESKRVDSQQKADQQRPKLSSVMSSFCGRPSA